MINVPGSEAFLKQATGKDVLAKDYVPVPVFSQSSGRRELDGFQIAITITDGPWKYISRPGDQNYLFDLTTDPHELKNLLAEKTEISERMHQVAMNFKTAHETRGLEISERKKAPMPKEVVNELHNLGYIGEDDEG